MSQEARGLLPEGLQRAKDRQAARDASGAVYVEGSIYEGMEACLVRSGRTVAHVAKYVDAVEIAEAVNRPSPAQADDSAAAGEVDADAEVARIMSLSDEQVLAEAEPEDIAWATLLRARLIAIKHALPGRYDGKSSRASLRGEVDDAPYMRAIREALATPTSAGLAPVSDEMAAELKATCEALATLPDDTPDHARFYIDMTHGQGRSLRAALSTLTHPQPSAGEVLEWMTNRDNLLLFNGTEKDGWWEVRRGHVRGGVRGRGPTPLAALQAAMIAASPRQQEERP